MKIGSALTTAWVAAALLTIFETARVVVLKREQPVGYFALNAVLLFVSATVIAIAFSWTDDPPAWITVALASAGTGLVWGLPNSFVTGTGLVLLQKLARRSRAIPLFYGVGLAVGLGTSAIVAPRFLARVPFVSNSSEVVLDLSLSVLLIVVVSSVVALCNRLSQTPLARPAPVLISLAFLSFTGLPYFSRSPSRSSSLPFRHKRPVS